MAEKPHSDHPGTETTSSIPARVWYTDPLMDTDATTAALRGAAAYSLGYLPTLLVTGKDRATWLNGLLTCDVSVVRRGVAAWGLLLDRVGKVQAVLGVVPHGETLLLAVLWGDAHEVHHQLDIRLVMEDAELEIAEDWHWTVGIGAAVAGPEGGAWGSLELAGPCTLIAEPSFTEFGSRHALSDAAWALWRLKHALPWGGIDFDAAARPHEATLDRKSRVLVERLLSGARGRVHAGHARQGEEAVGGVHRAGRGVRVHNARRRRPERRRDRR